MTSSGNEEQTERLYEVAREMRLLSTFDALFSHAAAEHVRMHPTDIETIDLLNVLGPMTAGQLSQLTGLSSGATTRLIDRVESAGLVRRRPDEHDRRRVIIEPVYENLTAVGEAYGPMAASLGRQWQHFSDGELSVILRFLHETTSVLVTENARLRGEAIDEAFMERIEVNPGHRIPMPPSA
ncbi:MAG TPA: MarR family transcriptional regulator [Dehalococcoidia bacterium]|nr:MarR family transcriptional regulator [Dehalococcoidia bacterium]